METSDDFQLASSIHLNRFEADPAKFVDRNWSFGPFWKLTKARQSQVIGGLIGARRQLRCTVDSDHRRTKCFKSSRTHWNRLHRWLNDQSRRRTSSACTTHIGSDHTGFRSLDLNLEFDKQLDEKALKIILNSLETFKNFSSKCGYFVLVRL